MRAIRTILFILYGSVLGAILLIYGVLRGNGLDGLLDWGWPTWKVVGALLLAPLMLLTGALVHFGVNRYVALAATGGTALFVLGSLVLPMFRRKKAGS